MDKQFSDAAKMARREYARQWRKRNPDKVRENNRRYWERKALETERGAADAEAQI